MGWGWPGVSDAPQKPSERLPNQYPAYQHTAHLYAAAARRKEHLCYPERNLSKQTKICFGTIKIKMFGAVI